MLNMHCNAKTCKALWQIKLCDFYQLPLSFFYEHQLVRRNYFFLKNTRRTRNSDKVPDLEVSISCFTGSAGVWVAFSCCFVINKSSPAYPHIFTNWGLKCPAEWTLTSACCSPLYFHTCFVLSPDDAVHGLREKLGMVQL